MEKTLYNFMIKDQDFMTLCNNNKQAIKDFISVAMYDNTIVYLDKKYLDISWLQVKNKLVDLDELWHSFKSFIEN